MNSEVNVRVFQKYDFYRGLSAYFVFLSHTYSTFFSIWIKIPVLEYVFGHLARYGVICFFILSGFLISYSTENNIRTFGKFNLIEYLKSRFVRIYPPFIFSLILCIFISYLVITFKLHGYESYILPTDITKPVRDIFHPVSFKDAAQALLLTYQFTPFGKFPLTNGPLWSLSYEFGFYIMFGLTMRLLSNITIKEKKYLILILFSLFILLLKSKNIQMYSFFGLVWLVGVFEQRYRERINTTPIYILGTFLLYFILGKDSFSIDDEYPMFIGQLGPVMLLTFIIFRMKFPFRSNLIFENFVFRFFQRSSKYSYTFYLIHFPLGLFSFSLLHPILATNPFLYFTGVGIYAIVTILLSKYVAIYLEDKKWLKANLSAAKSLRISS